MLFDIRTYRCKPGKIRAHLEIYEQYGRQPQERHLGQPLLFAIGETGDPNEFVHIWVYHNAADRENKRTAMWADPDWLAYTRRSAELGGLHSQHNKLVTNASWFTSSIEPT